MEITHVLKQIKTNTTNPIKPVLFYNKKQHTPQEDQTVDILTSYCKSVS